MLFEWMLELVANVMRALANVLPATGGLPPLPSPLVDWVGRFNYYIDFTPLMVFIAMVLALFAGFALWKIIIFIWRLLPFT